ncbi:gluconolactonase [Alkalilimnicola ehrlichii]|uniref:Gluconolactonase n=1 Tax=Alkalilimnicola ehrlichii TaxID=351052 RepID=A0A3E0WQ69_9GAMM|nr:SMP-30/gluconolactonase/LRE family protein [Alkalilimnicola ehrlichii]RFA25796.1 gluconolactonase [Alkalilimnicola ehrlichii]RFA35102.1 gluconolactonase [Alkalilimnicola ehrlichii]
MATTLRKLLDGGTFFEGPRWRDGRWWISDFYSHAVFTVTPEGEATQIAEVPTQPSGLGWLPDNSLLIVSMLDCRLLRQGTDGKLEPYADLSAYAGGHANDMVVDEQGRAWVGNFGFDLMEQEDPRPTQLVRVDPDGSVTPVADDLRFPNGSVITPDGRTLIVGETFANRMTAFTINADGSLGERRTWAQFGPTPELGPQAEMRQQIKVAPDGCCLDAEGHIWVADALNGRCLRVAEGGEIVEEVAAPEGLGVFACMLGGHDGRSLLLCCAPDSLAKHRAAAREASLWVCEVDVPHAGLP